VIASLRATGEHVPPAAAIPPMPAGLTEECEQVLTWLEQPGVRLVTLDGQWATPLHGAAAARARLPRQLSAAGLRAGGATADLLGVGSDGAHRRRRRAR
jgi:DNA polymerase-3 subunit epsilon